MKRTSMDREAWIRRMHAFEKKPIKQIARETGLSKNTVRRIVREPDPPKTS